MNLKPGLSVRKKLIALDFDGVIHNYTGWKGASVIEGPIQSTVDWIKEHARFFEFHVFSSRCKTPEGLQAVIRSLNEWGLGSCTIISHEKPSAWLTIDDRAFCFKGQMPTADEIESFRPWWQK